MKITAVLLAGLLTLLSWVLEGAWLTYMRIGLDTFPPANDRQQSVRWGRSGEEEPQPGRWPCPPHARSASYRGYLTVTSGQPDTHSELRL